MIRVRFFFFLIIILAAFMRFYLLDKVPPGLGVDEASIGYNAYSILKTGKDEHGQIMPLWFKAFGEYKLPVYVYSVVLSMGILGKNEFAIRAPFALFGVLNIIVLYFLVQKILNLSQEKDRKIIKFLPLLSSFVLAVTPWHIFYSRIGTEMNQALFFYLSACWLACSYLQKQKAGLLLFSLLFFTLTMYTYNAYRFITPVSLFILLFIYISRFKLSKRLIYFAILLFVFNLPLILFTFSPAGIERFNQVSILGNTTTVNFPVLKFFYTVIRNYLFNFSSNFLLFAQNQYPGLFISNFGLLLFWQAFFLLIGLYAIFHRSTAVLRNTVIGLLLIAPLSAVFTEPNAYTSRSLLLVVPIAIIIAYGIVSCFYKYGKSLKVFAFGVIVFGVYEFFLFSHFLFNHYIKDGLIYWGSANKQIIEEINKQKYQYSEIVVNTNVMYQPYIYLLFYGDNLKVNYVGTDWKKPAPWKDTKVLYVAYPLPSKNQDPNFKLVKTIYLEKHPLPVAQLWEVL